MVDSSLWAAPHYPCNYNRVIVSEFLKKCKSDAMVKIQNRCGVCFPLLIPKGHSIKE